MPDQKLVLHRQARMAVIEKYLASGQVQKEFCQNEQISYATFHYWLKKYRQGQTSSASGEPLPNCSVPITFSSAAVSHPAPCYTIEYPGGVVLHISAPLDPHALIQLIRAQDV
ncbi:MAG: IS66 family insertion sequence element accessory protein TnpA [Candidatus Zhuqueibacterota bacterium]